MRWFKALFASKNEPEQELWQQVAKLKGRFDELERSYDDLHAAYRRMRAVHAAQARREQEDPPPLPVTR